MSVVRRRLTKMKARDEIGAVDTEMTQTKPLRKV